MVSFKEDFNHTDLGVNFFFRFWKILFLEQFHITAKLSKKYRTSYTPCRHKGTAFPVINIHNQMLRLAIAKIKAPPEKLFGELLIVPKDELTYFLEYF